MKVFQYILWKNWFCGTFLCCIQMKIYFKYVIEMKLCAVWDEFIVQKKKKRKKKHEFFFLIAISYLPFHNFHKKRTVRAKKSNMIVIASFMSATEKKKTQKICHQNKGWRGYCMLYLLKLQQLSFFPLVCCLLACSKKKNGSVSFVGILIDCFVKNIYHLLLTVWIHTSSTNSVRSK